MHHWKNIVVFPIVMGVLGSIFSSRSWVLFLDSHSPPVGLVFYYGILFLTILFLQHIGLIIAQMPFDSVTHAVGTLLIIFSFFIVFNWESLYIDQITHQKDNVPRDDSSKISNVYLQSEDGAVYYIWYNMMNLSIEKARIMTYVVTPIILSAMGMALIRGKTLQWTPI